MSTIVNIIHLVIAFFGIFFLAYLLFQLWIKNKWRFSPKTYKKKLEARKAESRLQARNQGKKKFKFNQGKLIIWATSMRESQRIFTRLSEKEKNSQTEIF